MASETLETKSTMHELDAVLENVHSSQRANRDGAVATYIPELAQAEPDAFGLAIATVGGRIHTAGEVETPFTLQSVSKAFAFCLALELAGRDKVLSRVGVEPSGDAFNAIVFDPVTSRPFNPMVNAGAITIAGMLDEIAGDRAFDLILDRFSQAAGRKLSLDEAVYRSEAETGHRNRGIAHLLRASGALTGRTEEAVDLYFRQCSISATATDLARMGATLANMGENPSTGRAAFDLGAVRNTLAVMFTCGMYDYAGHWAYDVGIPAKSGVSGGIVGIVNRQLGIASYSPRLDAKGNSVRGIASFGMLSDELGLHAFDCTNRGSAFVSTLIENA